MTVINRRATAAAARRGAWLAFAVLIVLSPFRARIELAARPTVPVYGDYTNFFLFWSDIAMLLTIGLSLLSLVLTPRRLYVGPRFLAWPIGVLLMVAWLGVPFAIDPALAAYTSVRLTVLAVLGLYVLNEVDRLDRMVFPTALLVAIHAIVGIGQVVGQHSLGVTSLGEHVLTPNLGVSVITADDGTRFLRAYGLADHPNILGGVLALALILIGGAAATETDGWPSWRAAVFALGTGAVLLTFSRGAWLGLLAGLAVVFGMLWAMKQRATVHRLGVVCVSGLIVVAAFIAPYHSALVARTHPSGPSATEVRSVAERVALCDVTTQIVENHLAVGVGIGTLPLAIQAADPSFKYSYQPAGTVLLDVTAETGIVGGAAYLVILVAPWLALWRHRPGWTAELAVASGVLAVLSIIGLFDYYPWTYAAGRIWTALVLGLWGVAYRRAVDGCRRAV